MGEQCTYFNDDFITINFHNIFKSIMKKFINSLIGLYIILYAILTLIDFSFHLRFGSDIEWLHNLLLSFIGIGTMILISGIGDNNDSQ